MLVESVGVFALKPTQMIVYKFQNAQSMRMSTEGVFQKYINVQRTVHKFQHNGIAYL